MKHHVTMIALCLATGTMFLTGCGEKQQAQASAGRYQGKPDGKPWEASGKDKQAWETQIKTRAQNQNEYTRTE
jgi:hypothetical protein